MKYFHFWNFSKDRVYLKFDNKFREEMLRTAYKITDNWVTLAKTLNEKVGVIKYLRSGGFTSIRFLCKLCNFLESKEHKEFSKEKTEKFIREIKYSKEGKPICNPKLPIDLQNPSLGILIAAIHGDGTFTKKEVGYCNFNESMRLKVRNAVLDLFGEIPVYERLYKTNKSISFPLLVGDFIQKLGAKRGCKTITNQEIPSVILNNTKEVKRHYLRQIFDDEGCAPNLKDYKVIEIGLASDVTNLSFIKIQRIRRSPNSYPLHVSKILAGIKDLLKEFGIECCNIRSSYYEIKNKDDLLKKGIKWNLNISLHKNLKKFEREIGFTIDYKKKALREAVLSTKDRFRPGKDLEIILKTVLKIEKENGYVTKHFLAKEMRINKSTAKGWILNLKNKGLLYVIKNGKHLGYYGQEPDKLKLTQKALDIISGN